MSSVNLWGWDYANYAWVKVKVDADGHLQVDVLEAALPTDAATETTLALVEEAVDGLETLLGAGLPVALDTLSLMVREQGTPQQNCYGWSGAAWQKLLVEDATNFNLRVALYSGANKVTTSNWGGGQVLGDRNLNVAAVVQGLSGAAFSYIHALVTDVDNISAGYRKLCVQSFLVGFDGTYWDRLRTYGTGILKVGRAPIGATLKRLTAAGAVVSGAKYLMWMSVRTSAAAWLVALTDAIAGGGTVIWDNGGPQEKMAHYVFDPPIEFTTGIYLETFTNLTSVMFCYV